MTPNPKISAGKNLGISWPLIVWMTALSCLYGGNSMLQDADTYWHTAVGKWILEHRAIPHADPFSHSMPGAAWTAHEWLSEIIFALVHGVAGWSGLVILTAVSFAATLALLTRFLLRHLEPVHALILVALSAGMLRSHLLARPHMLAAPLLALWLFGLLAARERNSAPSYWLLPVMTVWANLHGSFTLGIALTVALGAEAIFSAKRPDWNKAAAQWGAFLFLSLLAAMATPFQWEGIAFTSHILSLETIMATIGEWRSPDFQGLLVFEVWLIALLAAALSGRLRLPPIRLLLIIGLVHLSLKHGRYMATTGIVAPFLIAQSFAETWYSAPKLGRDASMLDRIFVAFTPPARRMAIVAVTALTIFVSLQTIDDQALQPEKSITPAAALDALNTAKVDGPVFNQYSFGGYLIYSGTPVFIDGRADMYGDKFLESYVNATTLKSTKHLTNLFDKYHIAATILAPDVPATSLLDHLPGWSRIYADDIAVVHLKTQK